MGINRIATSPFLGRRAFLASSAGAALSLGLGSFAHAASETAGVTITRARLDALAAEGYATFNQNNALPPYDAARHAAGSDVQLYPIATYTQVPETGETVRVSGLLAVPAGVTGPIPVVSWQHGTILSFVQVPSATVKLADAAYAMTDGVDSTETLFNLQRFAARGYAVIAADYLGKGPFRGSRPEAYAVKDASVSTCVSVLNAGLQLMKRLDLEPAELFLNGWSQGALNTQWLRQELQSTGVPVRAAAAASPFNDLTEAFMFWTGGVMFPNPTPKPYPTGPVWLTLTTAILLGSYEAYYRLDGLTKAAVRPEYHDALIKFWNDYALDFDAAKMPTPEKLLIDGFFERHTSEVASRFLRQLAANRASFFDYGSPMRLFYGLADEAIHPMMARLPLPAGGRFIDGVAVANASHRATFLASLYGAPADLQGQTNLPEWFDSLRGS